MIRLPTAPDPALRALEVVLSDSAMTDMLEQHLPDCANGALHVESCRPFAARYKPGRSLLVRYRLVLRDTRTASKIKTLAKAELPASGSAEKPWLDPALAPLVERAARLHPELPVGRAAYVSDIQALVQIYPVDLRLPALVHATSPGEMCRVLSKALPERTGTTLRECQVELIRYKPAKRAVLRYRLGDAEIGTVFAKVRTDDRGAILMRTGPTLRAAGVPTPAPLAYLPDLRMVVHAEARGRKLSELRATDEFDAWMEPVAQTLAHIHTIRVDGLPVGPPHNGADAVLKAGQMIGTLLPDLATEAARLATTLATGLAAVRVPAVTIHGDFSAQQVLISDAGVVLLDFDHIKLGNPLLDVATFLAALSARQDGLTDAARAAFLEAYAAIRPEVHEHVLLFEAADLFKAAVGPFRRLRPNWPDNSERLMRLAAQRLEEHHRCSLPLAASIQPLTRQNRRRLPEYRKTRQ